MTIEMASVRAVPKPWGRSELAPWSELGSAAAPVGELWFERVDVTSPEPALLLKLIFTSTPLSIQVHPDDTVARTLGLPRGKTEAWYVLSAEAGARVALGLVRSITTSQLRAAIGDGSIADLVHWQLVRADEAIVVPAGTIHAIGAGLVIAEIQQRSDTTFRLFDYGRQRRLHVEEALASSSVGLAPAQPAPSQLSGARRLVARCAYFVLEHIELPAHSQWQVDATSETWVLLLRGDATLGPINAGPGQAVFVNDHRASMRAGTQGATGLIGYVASQPILGLLKGRNARDTDANIKHVTTPGRPLQ